MLLINIVAPNGSAVSLKLRGMGKKMSLSTHCSADRNIVFILLIQLKIYERFKERKLVDR